MEKSTIPNVFIARGIDQRSGIHNIPVGRAENQVNFDSDAEGFITKRKGYELHRNVPIRVVTVTDRGDNWEFVASPEINLLGVPAGPIVINGQAVDGSGDLVDVSFYWNTFDNLGAFTLTGTAQTIKIGHVKGLNTMGAVVRNDPVDSSNNEAIITDAINNLDLGGGQYQFDLDFASETAFDNSSYTLYSPDVSVVGGNEAYIASTALAAPTTVSGDVLRYSIPQAAHGVIGDNFIIQVWKNVSPTDRSFKLVERIYVSGTGDVEIDVDNPDGDEYTFYIIGVNDGFQQAAFIDAVTQADIDNETPKQFCLEDVPTTTNFWAFYRVDTSGNQELVVPDKVYYNQSTQQLCFDFYPAADGVFKAVYLPGLPVSAGVIVPKLDNSDPRVNTGDFDLENGELALHGIDWDGIVVSSLTPEFSYLRELDEYKSTALEKLVAVASGDLWIEDTATTYTLTASQQVEQAAQTQYLTPYFGASANAIGDGRNRGLDADEVTNNLIKVATITNNGNATVTVVSEALTGVTGNFTGLVLGTDKLTINNSERPEYTGEWTITGAVFNDLGGGQGTVSITVSIPDLPAYIPSTNDSGATIGIFTDYIVIGTNYDSIKVGDIINNLGGLLGSVVFALDDLNSRMWIDPVTAERLLPGSVDITWDRTDNVVFVDSIAQVVPQDIVNISGYDRRFKIIDIDTDNNSITLNESIRISNFFGSQSTITLDGRLRLPVKPDNNIAQSFPFSPTGNYSTEIATLGDGLYTTTYDRDIVKFDGTHISDAGIEEVPVYSHSWIIPKSPPTVQEFGFISPEFYIGTVSSATATGMVITADDDTESLSDFFVGQLIDIETADATAIFTTTITEINSDTNAITVEGSGLTFSNNDKVSVFRPTSFGYYFRIEYVDRNNRIQTGTVNDYRDALITIRRPSTIQHALLLPTTLNGTTEWDRFKISMYRTIGAPSTSDVVAIFFKVDDMSALELAGKQPADVDVSNLVVMTDTTTDESLAPGANIDVLRDELDQGLDSGNDAISRAQIQSVGGSSVERPISAARPPLAQHLLSANNKMIYANIKSRPKLALTWAKNRDVADLSSDDTTITVSVTGDSGTVNIPFQYVNDTTTGIVVADVTQIIKAADESDFTSLVTEESANAGFLTFTLDAPPGSVAGQWVHVIGEDDTIQALTNSFVGALVGWHRITTVSGSNISIRVPKTVADEFTVAETDTKLRLVYSTTAPTVIPIWDKVYNETPIYDLSLPNFENDISSRTSRNFAKAFNAYMKNNAYYARIQDQYNEPPISPAVNVDLSYSDWAYAKWGQAIGGNSVEIVDHSSRNLSFHVTKTGGPLGFELFSNGLLSNNTITGQAAIFPSRLVTSYGNYPESVDNPYALDPNASFSAIDVNSSDGEEVTGLANFFGESSTGAAQLSSTIIVFKTNSVYAVDINTKQIQRLQSMGQGCTIPDSIASTDDTIFFANDTGIYKVTRDLNVKYVGDLLGKYYDALNKTNLKRYGYGFTDNQSLSYKFAHPEVSSTNDKIAVYNFEGMSKQAEGAWFFHDGIQLSSAKQTGTKLWTGNYKGRIYQNRNYGDSTDYRDDDSPITATFEYAPQSFGDTGKYKRMSHAIVQFEGNGPTEINAFMATDLSSNYVQLDTARKGEGSWKGRSVAFSPSANQAVFYQLKLVHDAADEDCIINGVTFMVERTNEAKVEQAASPASGKAK